MHYIPFNSRKDYHKQPFGAVARGEKITFRVVLPRCEQCSAVRLTFLNDSKESRSHDFCWERMEGCGEEWWRLDVQAPEKGVWWYFFEFDTPWGTKKISRESAGIGLVGEGGLWQLTVYEPGDAAPSWLQGGIIYQIFPDRFRRSGKTPLPRRDGAVPREDWGAQPLWRPDENGRISEYDFFGGDLKGIEESLDYLESLGVSCIYLNPIFKARSNHRYDTADYMQIDPLLGDRADFESLCSSARARGIRIILDGVFSHTGADSVYFDRFGNYGGHGAYSDELSPYRSWYKFRSWPQDYVSWWGVDILPELEESDAGVLDFFTGENGVARSWLRAGASGWRLDVADELPDEFLHRFHKAVRSEKADGFIYGEVWEDATNKISYGQRRGYLLGGQLDSVMNYPLAQAICDFVKTADAGSLCETVQTIAENYPPSSIHSLMNHIGTHDTVRVITRLGRQAGAAERDGGRDRGELTSGEYRRGAQLLRLASLLQFTLPGVPCIYYGDEAGLTGGEDPYNRACFPWGERDEQLTQHYRALARLRCSCRSLKSGAFVPVGAALGCMSFERACESERTLIIANANDHEIDYRLEDGFWHAARAVFGEDAQGEQVRVPACGAAVLRKET